MALDVDTVSNLSAAVEYLRATGHTAWADAIDTAILLNADMPNALSVMDELLPCPFCGSSPEILEVEEGENAGGIAIQCTNPQCAASTAMIFPCGDDPEPLLIERWNRRA